MSELSKEEVKIVVESITNNYSLRERIAILSSFNNRFWFIKKRIISTINNRVLGVVESMG